jgi:hypothetical protein
VSRRRADRARQHGRTESATAQERHDAAAVRAEADRLFYAAAGAVPAHTLPTLRAVLSFRRQGKGCWASQRRHLAEATGLCERTVRRHVAALAAAGVLDVEGFPAHHDQATGQWRRRTNRYRCRFPQKRPGQGTRQRGPSPRGHARPHDVPSVNPDPPTPPVGGVSGGAVLTSLPVEPSAPMPAELREQLDRLRRAPGQSNRYRWEPRLTDRTSPPAEV